MTEQSPERAFLEYVLTNILDNPDEMEITETVDELGLLLSVKVEESDMGKIIGKSGQSIQALRTILRLMGSKRKERVNMKVLEPSKA